MPSVIRVAEKLYSFQEDGYLKKKRYTEPQIVFALQQSESGAPIAELCRKMGVAEATFFR